MKRFWPVFLIYGGAFLLLAGGIYNVMFAGIPYQDPTPEMSARYAHHKHIASMICRFGGGVFLVGAVACIFGLIVRRFRRPVV